MITPKPDDSRKAAARHAGRFAAAALLVSSFFLDGRLAGAEPPSASAPASGIPATAGGGIAEKTGEIMARHTRMAVTAPQVTLDFFLGRADPSRKKVDPEAAQRQQGPATGPQPSRILSSPGPLAAQTVGVTGDSPTTPSPCGTPPDTMGAAGPTQFVVFENCNIVTYSKATGIPDGVLNTTPNNFFTSVRSSSTSDPHVRYDRLTQRWFLVIIDVTFPRNRVLLAVSNTATITNATTWTFFFFSSAIGTHTNCLADYPTPGLDANAVYVGVNQFCGSSLGTASYAGSDVFVVQKSSVLGAGPIHVTGFQSPSDMYTPQGVDNPDPAATEGWVLGGSVSSFNRLNLVRVSNPGSLTPTISATVPITTANQGNPIPQPHLGNTGGANGRIDAIDNRPLLATYRDGRLWTAMPVGVTVSGSACNGVAAGTPDRDAVFWWELQGIPTGSTPSIVQSGAVCDTASLNPTFFSYGTIAPNGQVHAAIGYTIAGNNTFISGGAAGRLASDPAGTFPAFNVVFAPGAGAYNPGFDSGAGRGFRRWGDYSFTGVDPCNDQSIWTIQEFVPTANQYGSRFAELKAPPPATPVSVSPPSVASGQASATVIVTGTSSSGSGFYDTPSSMSGEPCRTRLTSAVSGGVTVSTATFTDPTHVTLNISTVGATAGAQNVTVTNPDGQSASGAGILTITAPCTPATPTITGPSSFCAGSSITLTSSSATGNLWSTGATTQSITVSLAGSYTVTVTDANGCSATSLAKAVTSNPLPPTPTISGPSRRPGTSTSPATRLSRTPWLTSSSPTGNLWSTGATTQAIPVLAPGSYTVTVTNANGCQATSLAKVVLP